MQGVSGEPQVFQLFKSAEELGLVLFIDDMSELLGASRSTIERRIRTGTFPFPEMAPVDNRRRWSKAKVLSILEQEGSWRPQKRRSS